MIKYFRIGFFSLVFVSIVEAQQDTILYDSVTGDYVIQYLRTNSQTGERDSLVRVTFTPATKIDPSVNCSVRFEPNSNMYIYQYEITNGRMSKQNLITFRIQFGRGVDVLERSAQSWRGRRRRGFADESLNRIWSWYGNQGLQPTWEKSGFALGSPGLPGIGIAFFQGNAPLLKFEHGLPSLELDQKLAELQEFPANHVARPTVAPVAPLVPFVGVISLDTLLSYTRQSVQLGWLGTRRDDDCDDDERPDDGMSKNIEKRLEKAKNELSKGDSTKSRKELQKLVDKVERTWKRSQEEEKKHKGEQRQRKEEVIMTSEAYALLKYNTEYLIDRLPSEKKKSKK